jgi:hypothetical protein
VLKARNVLGTPVPRVLAWSSKAQENPVGAEYIIMEKVLGIELEHVWPSMNIKDRLTLVKTIAGFQKSWTSVSFKKFGSLYYANDLDESTGNEPLYVDATGVDIIDKKFAIGPSYPSNLSCRLKRRPKEVNGHLSDCQNSLW